MKLNNLLKLILVSMFLWGCEEPDNEAPTISILSPSDGVIVSEGIEITCIANDNKEVEKVELWVDGISLDVVDHNEPYSLVWNSVGYLNGSTHVITVRAYDTSDNSTDSSPISLTINQNNSFPVQVNVNRISFNEELTSVTAYWHKSADLDFGSYRLLYWNETNQNPTETIIDDIDITEYTVDNSNPNIVHYFQIIVMDVWGLETVGNTLGSIPLQPPTAALEVDLEEGYTGTDFQFDAGSSSDPNESDSQLRFRWDWESDGNWDTDYSSDDKQSNSYTEGGTYLISVEVIDSQDMTDLAEVTVLVTQAAGVVEDVDGNIYSTIVIGGQEWLAENFKVTRFRNGDSILTGMTSSEWQDLYGTESPAYCLLDDEEYNIDRYGFLYNWFAANNDNFCPAGWRLPNDSDWKELEMYLGMSESSADSGEFRGTSEGSMLAGSANLWINGTLEDDSYFGSTEFNVVPGGQRSLGGSYDNWGSGIMEHYAGAYWSSTSTNDYGTLARLIDYDDSRISRYVESKYAALSVRLIRD